MINKYGNTAFAVLPFFVFIIIWKKSVIFVIMKIKNIKKDNKKDEPKEWKIVLYETETGRCPVNDYMNTLGEEDKEDMLQRIEELKIIGNNIRRPKGDILRDKIYELRISLRDHNIRTLFFFCYKDYIVLTNAFSKKTDKIPDNEIEKAIKYRNTFLEKYNKNNIEEAYNVGGLRKIWWHIKWKTKRP